jgi:hypothetical protein
MVCRLIMLIGWLVVGLGIVSTAAGAANSAKLGAKKYSNEQKIIFEKEVKPLLTRYCYPCHGEKKKGDLDLRIYRDEKSVAKHQEVFEKVLKNLQAHEMPPENKPQPTAAERALITRWVTELFFPCDCNHPDPGRVTIRRLNRVEYNNTIRDLVGVNFKPADDFPEDDTGYGFDNIGDALSLSPVLLEKYLTAAEKIMDAAIVTGPPTNGPVQHFQAAKLESTAPGGPFGDGARLLSREGEVFVQAQLPAADEYILRARAFGQQAGPDPARMEFRIDGKAIKVFDVTAVEAAPAIYETRVTLPAGKKRIAAAYINNYVKPDDPDPNNRDRNLIIDYLEVVGSITPPPPPLADSHKRIFICPPEHTNKAECARTIIASFARRAFRRPVAEEEIGRLLKLFKSVDADSGSFENSIKVTLQAVLMSPHFLFRGELQPEPGNPKRIHPIDDFALASRLSYFLWSSMPDDELFRQAERGTLRRNLESQVKRMLRDPKAGALVENFAGQWLQLRNLDLVMPDAKQFPDFDEDLRKAMRKETEMFVGYILCEDRSILEFIDADYTFANERLARFYGVPGLSGGDFQRVSLKGTRRGGLLTQASILTITSNPTRTSPVKRGKWVLENILGTPPPPPPPNVPNLKEGKEAALSGTLRQRMEQHRDNPNCVSCHARMDPIGFGFENYDGIGAWREKEGDFAIDASGKLVSGESFNGAAEFKLIFLKQKRDEFVRCLTEKMLTYALGRGMEYYDKCAVDQITKSLGKNRYKLSALVLDITRSTPFQMRRGEEDKLAENSP